MIPTVRKNQDWLPDIFNDFFDNSWMERAASTAPAVNVIETEKEYEVEVAAPGLTKEDFNVRLDNEGNLLIHMEKKTENKEEKKHGRFLRREFSYTNFQQAFSLPDDANAEKIQAKVENGVLSVIIPKFEEEEKPEIQRQIEIQ